MNLVKSGSSAEVGELPRRKFKPLDYGLYVFVIIMVVVFSQLSDKFFTTSNLMGMFLNSLPLVVIAIGMTFVIISGDLDLSVGSILLTSGTLGSLLMDRMGIHPIPAIIVTVLVGMLIGMLNGFMIAILGMHPWITTLSMQLVLRGFSFTFSQSTNILLPSSVTALRNIKAFGAVPVILIFVLLFMLIMQILLKYTVFGRQICLIGSNRPAAEKIGLNVKKLRFMIFTLSGTLAGIAAVVAYITMGAITPFSGRGYEFTATTAVVVGGTSMAGGKGCVFPFTLLGIFIISCLENGLSIAGANPYMFELLRGMVIFAGMLIDSAKNRKTAV